MVAELSGELEQDPSADAPIHAVHKRPAEADRQYGDARDPLDIAELSGLSESQVRAVIKRLEQRKEIPKKSGITRKRDDGRQTTHYREPVLGKIMEAVELILPAAEE